MHVMNVIKNCFKKKILKENHGLWNDLYSLIVNRNMKPLQISTFLYNKYMQIVSNIFNYMYMYFFVRVHI